MKKLCKIFFILITIFSLTACNNQQTNTTQIEQSTLKTTYKEKPKSKRPNSTDPLDNIFIAFNELNNADYYTSESTGEVIAKKSIKLATQNISSRKIVTPEAAFSESISISTFVKVAEQLYSSEDKVLKREASKVTSNSTKWENSATKLTTTQYLNQYGYDFKDPTRYIINEETVSNIQIITNGIGRKYTYKFNLDPIISPHYYKTSIKNLSNSTTDATFSKIEMTLTFDYKWRISRIEINETYKITMKGLGTVTCEASLTEVIKNFNRETSIEESSFFEKYL